MDGRRDTPDWVVCTQCRTVYAPALLGVIRCPKCDDARWEASAIPDSDGPLETPLQTALRFGYARWM